MSSILTNSSSMVALQTLRGINMNLNKTQDEISTGKSVDQPATIPPSGRFRRSWNRTLKSFKGISDSLSLGQSTVAVARKAAETVTDLLTEIKARSSPPRNRTSTGPRSRPTSAY